jgi:hypothetical protein
MVDLVNQTEAAALLGVSEAVVSRHRAAGRLAFLKSANGSIAIHRRHVLALAKILAAPRPSKIIRMSRDCAELPSSITRPIIRRSASV